MAALYDPVVRKIDEAGLGEQRRALLEQASGRTIEVGAGTGRNLEHYPSEVSELVLTEPDRHMAKKLRQNLEKSERAQIVQASGERLPFEEGSFDTAVATLVLCTAPDPRAVVDEVARILKPGGRFLFLEHVRAEDDERLAKRQDRAAPITNYLFCGCHPNRRTLATIEASPLEVERVERGELPEKGSFEFERPMIVGVARRPG
jgi:ubiquinone/menaquinone biosynthesis C-methylase UbiE